MQNIQNLLKQKTLCYLKYMGPHTMQNIQVHLKQMPTIVAEVQVSAYYFRILGKILNKCLLSYLKYRCLHTIYNIQHHL